MGKEAVTAAIVRLYGQFLSLYPADFRESFGEEMTAVFTEAITEVANKAFKPPLFMLARTA
jgi:hypothetical protein